MVQYKKLLNKYKNESEVFFSGYPLFQGVSISCSIGLPPGGEFLWLDQLSGVGVD